MAIGWVESLATANTYYSTRIGMISTWSGLTDADKTAALTTAYNFLYYSPLLSIPSSPTAVQLAKLQYAQQEYAAILYMLSEGGIRREAAISQGIVSAGIIKESYKKENAGIPERILDILDEFKTETGSLQIDIFRNENDNPAFDSEFA